MLANQRLRFPWEGAPFRIKAEFATAQAVTPGQGQTVRVVGRAGRRHHEGRPEGRPRRRHDGPRPGVQGLRPHRRERAAAAEDRARRTCSSSSTRAPAARRGRRRAGRSRSATRAPDVNPDEIFSVLDDDTRDYLKLLIGGAGQGLRRPRRRPARPLPPLRAHAPRPRARQRRRRRAPPQPAPARALARACSTPSSPARTTELAALVDSSSKVFRAFASEQQNLGRAVRRPAGHAAADDRHAGQGRALRARPAPDGRRPAPAGRRRSTAPTRRSSRSREEATPIVREQIRPFVRDARPLVRSLKRAGDRPRRRDARPDAHVHAPQPLPQPRRLQRERPPGPDRRRPRRGLPLLARLAAAQRRVAVLELGRQRPVPPGDARRDVHGPQASSTGDNPPLNLLYQPALLNQQVCGNG